MSIDPKYLKDFTKYICEVLNYIPQSETAINEIGNEIVRVRDIAAYKAYLEKNANNYDYRFLKGLQKFKKITSEYLELEIRSLNASKIETAEKLYLSCCKKVKSVRLIQFKDFEIDFEHIRIDSEGVVIIPSIEEHKPFMSTHESPYFTEKEIEALRRVGNLKECVNIQEPTGRDYLFEKMLRGFEERHVLPQITQREDMKSLAALTANVKRIGNG